MTCVAVVTDGNKTVIGGDSLIVKGGEQELPKNRKVFKKTDPSGTVWLCGFCGSCRMGQIFQYVFRIPEMTTRNRNNVRGYMVSKFVPALKKCFSEEGYQGVSRGRKMDGSLLVVFLGKIFVIDEDYHVAESSDPFSAIGVGEAPAKGSLYTSASFPDLRQRIQCALEAAQKFSAGVREPFVMLEEDIP